MKDLEVVIGIVNEVHSYMLEAGNGFDRLKEIIKSNTKKVDRKVKSVNKKLPTLENLRIGTSVASPLVPTYLNMN